MEIRKRANVTFFFYKWHSEKENKVKLRALFENFYQTGKEEFVKAAAAVWCMVGFLSRSCKIWDSNTQKGHNKS